MMKGSTICPWVSYQGGLPLVYMVLLLPLRIGSLLLQVVDADEPDKEADAVRCLRERGDLPEKQQHCRGYWNSQWQTRNEDKKVR